MVHPSSTLSSSIPTYHIAIIVGGGCIRLNKPIKLSTTSMWNK
ncbi:MAG: hypothetical protein JWO04_2373 [Gammaproteobacteria bacterium]|jgi:hypothetical protein|nr:hypothetical protein [Gammaproteobacteria bacterium]